jgi:ribosome maturation factor RimP
MSWIEKVEQMAQQVATAEGCRLYDIEFSGIGKGRTLRVYVDREDGNPTIDDCSNVSKGLNELLDANDPIPGESYNLEVSTPGLDRVLKKQWHFERVVGKKIYVKTLQALESAGVTDKKWKASKTVEEVLSGADAQGISFKVKDVEFKIPYAMIEKAKLVFEMNKGQKK